MNERDLIEVLDEATLIVQQELEHIERVDMPSFLELEKRSYCQGKLHAIWAIKNALLGGYKEDE